MDANSGISPEPFAKLGTSRATQQDMLWIGFAVMNEV
jgi:hypothetical protein